MKKISSFLFLIIISISINAQNEIKKKITNRDIDSLKVKFDNIIERINLIQSQPPKLSNLNNDEVNLSARISLQDECGMIVTKTIEKFGWLSIPLVRDSINNNFGIILNYANDSIKNKFKFLVKSSVLKGESNPINYAELIDGLLVYNGELQLYGTKVGPDIYSDEFKIKVYEIFEPEYVNQRRKEIGLNTIQDYLKIYEINWEVPQKEK